MSVVLIRAVLITRCSCREAISRHVTRYFALIVVLDDVTVVIRSRLDSVYSCSNEALDVAACDNLRRVPFRRRKQVQGIIDTNKKRGYESHSGIDACIVQIP